MIILFENKKILISAGLLFSAIILIAIFVFVNISEIKAPKTEVYVTILEVTSEEIILETTINITNPNNFDLSFHKLEMITSTKDNYKIGKISFDGGKIKPNQQKTFYSKDKVFFKNGSDFSVIKSNLSGEIGISFYGFIQKIIFLQISVTTSVEEVFESFDIPEIDMELDFDNLTTEGIEFTVKVNLYNPTKMEFGINELSIIATTETEDEVGRLIIYGSIVKPKESTVFTSKGKLHYNAFDSKKIIFMLNGTAHGKIGGLEKKIDLSTNTELIIPDITEFIFKNQSIDFQIPVQFKLTLRGIITTIGFNIFNPSEIPLEGRNLLCSIFRLDRDKKTLLGQEEMMPCTILPNDSVCVKTQILIPYRIYLFSGPLRLIPDWIMLSIDGHFSIAGTRQEFPILLNAFVDPSLIKQKDFN